MLPWVSHPKGATSGLGQESWGARALGLQEVESQQLRWAGTSGQGLGWESQFLRVNSGRVSPSLQACISQQVPRRADAPPEAQLLPIVFPPQWVGTFPLAGWSPGTLKASKLYLPNRPLS